MAQPKLGVTLQRRNLAGNRRGRPPCWAAMRWATPKRNAQAQVCESSIKTMMNLKIQLDSEEQPRRVASQHPTGYKHRAVIIVLLSDVEMLLTTNRHPSSKSTPLLHTLIFHRASGIHAGNSDDSAQGHVSFMSLSPVGSSDADPKGDDPGLVIRSWEHDSGLGRLQTPLQAGLAIKTDDEGPAWVDCPNHSADQSLAKEILVPLGRVPCTKRLTGSVLQCLGSGQGLRDADLPAPSTSTVFSTMDNEATGAKRSVTVNVLTPRTGEIMSIRFTRTSPPVIFLGYQLCPALNLARRRKGNPSLGPMVELDPRPTKLETDKRKLSVRLAIRGMSFMVTTTTAGPGPWHKDHQAGMYPGSKAIKRFEDCQSSTKTM
ncbi:hypothetical protein CONLIGDRAFT_693757 [Coniochaeta ligniaria NRRL 30616]|uniref:Uncharacterized protein n=1 Tax=Coniochaeta ligniaria NRRL 30616 TaxID=1408157 RepID=A0A1J7I6E0_9PEZI|nr:hypothetical protein CONLIGDRAFT_693757 [Coniochaeta ligniaria NRRL 30616]